MRIRVNPLPEYDDINQLGSYIKMQLRRQHYSWPSINDWTPQEVQANLCRSLAEDLVEEKRVRVRVAVTPSSDRQNRTAKPNPQVGGLNQYQLKKSHTHKNPPLTHTDDLSLNPQATGPNLHQLKNTNALHAHKNSLPANTNNHSPNPQPDALNQYQAKKTNALSTDRHSLTKPLKSISPNLRAVSLDQLRIQKSPPSPTHKSTHATTPSTAPLAKRTDMYTGLLHEMNFTSTTRKNAHMLPHHAASYAPKADGADLHSNEMTEVVALSNRPSKSSLGTTRRVREASGYGQVENEIHEPIPSRINSFLSTSAISTPSTRHKSHIQSDAWQPDRAVPDRNNPPFAPFTQRSSSSTEQRILRTGTNHDVHNDVDNTEKRIKHTISSIIDVDADAEETEYQDIDDSHDFPLASAHPRRGQGSDTYSDTGFDVMGALGTPCFEESSPALSTRIQPKRAGVELRYPLRVIDKADDLDYDPYGDNNEDATDGEDAGDHAADTGIGRKRRFPNISQDVERPKKKVAAVQLPVPPKTANIFDTLEDRLTNIIAYAPRIWNEGNGMKMVISYTTPRSGAELYIDLGVKWLTTRTLATLARNGDNGTSMSISKVKRLQKHLVNDVCASANRYMEGRRVAFEFDVLRPWMDENEMQRFAAHIEDLLDANHPKRRILAQPFTCVCGQAVNLQGFKASVESAWEHTHDLHGDADTGEMGWPVFCICYHHRMIFPSRAAYKEHVTHAHLNEHDSDDDDFDV